MKKHNTKRRASTRVRRPSTVADRKHLLEQIALAKRTQVVPPFSLDEPLLKCSHALKSCLNSHGMPLSLPSELLPPLP